jgi:hypothetical protein
MIWNWLIGQLRRVPNRTPLLESVWSFILAVLVCALAVAAMFGLVFPFIDSLLAPQPSL